MGRGGYSRVKEMAAPRVARVACFEGNYAIANMLTNARVLEKRAAEAAAKEAAAKKGSN